MANVFYLFHVKEVSNKTYTNRTIKQNHCVASGNGTLWYILWKVQVKLFSHNKGANSTSLFELIDHSATFVDDLNHKMFCLIIILALTKEIQLLLKH